MDDLTFHLPNLVNSKGEQTDFTGPLSLILQLLSRNKVEIKDIRIGDILDQYLAWLDGMERMDLEVTGEFITMASYLLYIKAKTLLEGTRDVEELGELISSLEAQQRKETLERMKLAALWLGGRSSLGEGILIRPPEPITGPPEYRYAHHGLELRRALREIMSRERDAASPPRTVPMPAPLSYSIRDKSDEILLRLRDSGRLSLEALFSESRSRSELTAAFLAVLELYRAEQIGLMDTEGGIELTRYEE
jgi:segregation and condensation protein A